MWLYHAASARPVDEELVSTQLMRDARGGPTRARGIGHACMTRTHNALCNCDCLLRVSSDDRAI